MAKLHFLYSVMNAGKTTHLLQVRHNYIENGGNVMLARHRPLRLVEHDIVEAETRADGLGME